MVSWWWDDEEMIIIMTFYKGMTQNINFLLGRTWITSS